jgi:hypothetical protein
MPSQFFIAWLPILALELIKKLTNKLMRNLTEDIQHVNEQDKIESADAFEIRKFVEKSICVI